MKARPPGTEAGKTTEVEGTLRKQRLDILGPTKTQSRRLGWQCVILYTSLELGAGNVEGKAVIMLVEAGLTMRPQGATNTKIVVPMQLGDADRPTLVLLYVRPGVAGPVLYRQ